jgi:hypothetical protein
MTVLEVTIALSLLAMGMALTAQVFTLCARQHLASEQLLVAQWEAANVLEHFAGLRYDEITPKTIDSIQPSPQLHAALPDAKLQITVSNSVAADSSPSHKRIHVVVAWPAEEGSPHSVSLTTWKFPASSASGRLPREAAQ